MKKFLALVLSLCLVLSLAACGGKTADDDTGEGSKTGGTIQVGLNSAPVSMNIWCQNDLNSATIMNLVCPNLVAIDDDGNKYDYLTESSESNEDCTVWTIDHVGFGVDCMYGDHVGLHHAFAAALSTGDTSKTTVPYQEVPFVKYLENPTEASWNIPRWLIKHGYTDEEIIKVLGGNAVRVLREVWS